MCCVRFTMSSSDRKEVEHQLKTAQHLGSLRQVKYLLAILAVLDGRVPIFPIRLPAKQGVK